MQMVRPSGKARKIAWDILGKPANMTSKRTPHQDAVNRRILAEETSRVR